MAKITCLQAISRAMAEELRRDEKVFLMGEDIGLFGGCFHVTTGLQEEFGDERIMETPISEGSFADIGIGAAIMGYRPIIEIMYSDFLTVCMDALVNQAAKMRFMTGGQVSIPIVFRTTAGGGTGAAAQHSQNLEAWFCHVPGLKVIAPSCAYDALGLLKQAIRENNPVLFLEHKLSYAESMDVPDGEFTLPIGKAHCCREGEDITLISYSYTVGKTLEAARMLEKSGISAEVIDLRTLSPLDTDAILTSVKKTGHALIAQEAMVEFGVAAEIAAVISQSDALFSLKKPIKRVGAKRMPLPFAKELEQAVLPQAMDIYHAALGLISQ